MQLWLSSFAYLLSTNASAETEEISQVKQTVIPLKFFLISVNRREKTVAGGGARTWPSLLVRIPVWTLLYPASYVHMCYTRFIYQWKEHLSSLAVWVNRRSMRKQSFVCQFASTVCHGCYSCSQWICKRCDAYSIVDKRAYWQWIMLGHFLKAELKVASPLLWESSLYRNWPDSLDRVRIFCTV